MTMCFNTTLRALGSAGGIQPTNLKMLVYDFDCTISCDHVFHALSSLDVFVNPTPMTQFRRLKKVPDEVVLKWFGGRTRVERLAEHFTRMRDGNRTLCIISHGFHDVVTSALERVGLGSYFDPSYVFGSDSPKLQMFQGDKSKLIKQLMEEKKLESNEVIFIDDDNRNLRSAKSLCALFHLQHRRGLTSKEMLSLEELCNASHD